MTEQYRRLAVFVDHTGELGDGNYLWIVIESTDDPAVWLDLETGDETYATWIDAQKAGNAALLAYVDDDRVGPVTSTDVDDDEPEEA